VAALQQVDRDDVLVRRHDRQLVRGLQQRAGDVPVGARLVGPDDASLDQPDTRADLGSRGEQAPQVRQVSGC
jgi:hypothetical protein